MPNTKLQVLLSLREDRPMVAGLPAAIRMAVQFGDKLQSAKLPEVERILLRGWSAESLAPWMSRLHSIPWLAVTPEGASLKDLLSHDAALLILAPEVLAEAESFANFLAEAGQRSAPTFVVEKDAVIAAYYPNAKILRDLPSHAESAAALDQGFRGESLRTPKPEEWTLVLDNSSAAAAEAKLFSALRQDSDGYLARLDRKFSIALSKRLLAWPITPNQITTVSLILGLLGAFLIASAHYAQQLWGAALLWFCCILDGCDGEIARLKLLSSPSGARYDVIADNVVHVAIFLALPLALHRAHPGVNFLPSAAFLCAGVLLSMFWVWRLILSQPAPSSPLRLIYERIASRDFIYIVGALTLIGRLEWFVWAAAAGSHLFWISLLIVSALPSSS